MFDVVWRSNVQEVRKVCHKISLCVLVCFIMFYVLILNESYVSCPKIVYEHILVINVWETLPKEKPKVLEERPI